MEKWHEWERYNECEPLCRKVGCSSRSIRVCCPELMTELCIPKKQLLNELEINETQLIENKITLEEILERMNLR